MRNCNKGFAIAFCAVAVLIRPANAIIAFDFTETPQTFTTISVALENVAQVKAQLKEMGENLKAIGDVQKSITQYAPDFSTIEESLVTTNEIIDTINSNLETHVLAQNELRETNEMVDNAQKEMTKQLVDNIEADMKIALNSEYKTFKLAQNDITAISYIEEEEEESIDVETLKNKINEVFDKRQKESALLTTELNDVFDETIYIMNKGSDLNDKALSELSNILWRRRKDLGEEKRTEFKERLANLLIREQKVADLGVEIAETAKNNYNKEYQEQIKEGINNYQKAVLAYADGNISKNDMLEAGTPLKEVTVKKSNYADEKLLKDYETEISSVREDAKKLAEDIISVLSSKADKS